MTLFLGLLSKSNIKLSCFSLVQLFVTLWTTAGQTPLSVGFSRQEYWSGLLFPPPGDLLDPGIKPSSLMSPALAGRFFATSATWEAQASHWSIVDTTQRWYYFKCVITHLWLIRCHTCWSLPSWPADCFIGLPNSVTQEVDPCRLWFPSFLLGLAIGRPRAKVASRKWRRQGISLLSYPILPLSPSPSWVLSLEGTMPLLQLQLLLIGLPWV